MAAAAVPGIIPGLVEKLFKGDVLTYNWVILAVFAAPLYTPWTVQQVMVIVPWVLGFCAFNNLILMLQKNGARFFEMLMEVRKTRWNSMGGAANGSPLEKPAGD